MKKLLLLLLVFPLAFAACSDDDKDEDAQKTIVGRWIFKELTADVKTNNEAATEYIKKSMLAHSEEWDGERWTFNADGSFEIHMLEDGGFIFETKGTYTIKDNKIIISYEGEEDDPTERGFILSEDVLQFVDDEKEYYENLKEQEAYKDLVITKAISGEKYTRLK